MMSTGHYTVSHKYPTSDFLLRTQQCDFKGIMFLPNHKPSNPLSYKISLHVPNTPPPDCPPLSITPHNLPRSRNLRRHPRVPQKTQPLLQLRSTHRTIIARLRRNRHSRPIVLATLLLRCRRRPVLLARHFIRDFVLVVGIPRSILAAAEETQTSG